MAEALLRHRLAERGVDAHVHSAGQRFEGEPASDYGVEVLAERGIDLSGHRSRMISTDLLRGADLIVTMAREHLREAVLVAPDIWQRAFTLKELVRRGDAIGPRVPGESMEAWLTRAQSGRERAELLGSSEADDVDDPIGQGRPDYARTSDELSALIDRLVELAWPPAAAARESA